MCNHSFDANCSISGQNDGTIVLTAARDIPAGAQLTLSYGKLNNRQLMLDYGFTVPSNPYEHVGLAFSVDAMTVRFGE